MKLLCLIFLCLSLEWPAFASTETYRIMAAHAEMSGMLATGLEAFRKDCGRYPTTAEGWAALIHCPTNLAAEDWHGPYLKTIPLDPWGKAYVYTCPGLHQTNGYDIFSCGPDAKAGTDDDESTWDGYIPPEGLHPPPDGRLFRGLLFWVNLALVFLAVRLGTRPKAAKVRQPLDLKMWAGIAALIWFTLGMGYAMRLPDPIDQGLLAAVWFDIGVVLAAIRLLSGSKLGKSVGWLALLEFIFFVGIWLVVPRIAG
jgi:type II secretion system protein G